MREVQQSNEIVGFTAGAFDLLHTGHVLMLDWCKKRCDILVVGLQTDPSIDRSDKNRPIQSIFERYTQLNGSKFVDKIMTYDNEDDLLSVLNVLSDEFGKRLVRFIGEDHKGKSFTGDNLSIEVIFNPRSHGYSTTCLRNKVKQNG